jgi:hypothetical protein
MPDDAEADIDSKFMSAATRCKRALSLNALNWSSTIGIIPASLSLAVTVRVDIHSARQKTGDIRSRATARHA